MSQHYSDPKRETFTHLDVEMKSEQYHGPGWYWWSCFPGCLPDGDPMGPFATEAEALADARSGIEEEE